MMETNTQELKDIIDGLAQRINAYKAELQELQKQRERLDDEIRTIKKYLELAETLYRVELEKASAVRTDPARSTGVTDRSRELLLGRSKYAGLSVPQAAFLLFQERDGPLHAKEICRVLTEGGVRLRGKTPVTGVATALKRDPRFRKVAPNTFALMEQGVVENTNQCPETSGAIDRERG